VRARGDRLPTEEVRVMSTSTDALRPLLAIAAWVALAACARSPAQPRLPDFAAPPTAPTASAGAAPEALFDGAPRLERAALVEAVLARNPSLEAARQGVRAALSRAAQASAFDDPMLDVAVAPASFGSREVSDGYMFELSQAIPFPGKRRLRGELALAEAEAEARDWEALRLRTAALASTLFDDHYTAARSLEITAAHRRLLEELREIALAQYEAGLASAQDPLAAEAEIVERDHRTVMLETRAKITAERINALLHRRTDAVLPPPPPTLRVPVEPEPDVEALVAAALATRPELRSAEARVAGRESALRLARRERLPDFRVWGRYDRVWQERDLRPLVGVSIDVPLQLGRLRAQQEEAEAELARARSQHARAEDDARLAVVQAVERWRESRHLLELTRDRLLPAARDRADAARSAYASGAEGFLAVIDAERRLLDAELAYEETLADLSRRRAEIARATGRLPTEEIAPGSEEIAP
jgi:outer membrane protein TolC